MNSTRQIHHSFLPINDLSAQHTIATPAVAAKPQSSAATLRHHPQSSGTAMRRLLLQKAKNGGPKALADHSALLRTHAYLQGATLLRDYEVVTYASPDGQTFKVAGKRMPGDQSRFLVKNPETGETLCELKRTPTVNGRFVWRHPALSGLRGGAGGYTLDDAIRETEFPDPPDCAETVEEKLRLQYMSTSLDQIFDPEEVDEIKSGYLFRIRTMGTGYEFDNYYSRRVWIMDTNVRNPRWCDFFMSDVVAFQVAMAGCLGTDLRYLIRNTINSDTGREFFNNHSFNNLDFMSADQLHDFMTTTVNGKSSQRILDEFGLQVCRAQIVFDEDDDSDDEGTAYSVILKIESADS